MKRTIVAIDYDDTYTTAPLIWMSIIKILYEAGFIVYIITYRASTQFSDMDMKIPFIEDTLFTGGMGKRDYCESNGIHVNIWIDDYPESILFNYKNLPMSNEGMI